MMKNYSNYHSTNENAKISHDGLLLLERSLIGFEADDVIVNNSVDTRLLVYQKYDADSRTKKIIGRIEDVELGNLVQIRGEDWLVVTFPEDNKIFRKAEIQLCNSTYPIKSNKTRVLKGHNTLGKPIYEEIYEIDTLTPCIVESRNYVTDTNSQLIIPNNSVLITLKHQPSETIAINYEFTMYNNKYKITDIDYTKVINDKGIIKIIAERV